MQVTCRLFGWKILKLTEDMQIDNFHQIQGINFLNYKFEV